MSNIKLSNKIFELGLTAKELSIYAYLCSLPNDYPTLDGAAVKVKQATIAQKCDLKFVQTYCKLIACKQIKRTYNYIFRIDRIEYIMYH